MATIPPALEKGPGGIQNPAYRPPGILSFISTPVKILSILFIPVKTRP